ncbi:MAG: helix-turn-helix transcriptional regulator [Streptomyces sp.]|nr:helix-turn-helix transcriptional regulator [Streptomyces sp.]NUS24254.1 helix-turn-helix transcriptional regulator [Streptomyces sp.]
MLADQPQWIPDALRTLGTRIRAQRLHRNLTQEQLAERAGIDRSTVQRIEGGLNDPRHSHLLRIARALDTPLADLVR